MSNETTYIVRLIGSEFIKRIECQNREEAVKELREAYDTTNENHDNGSWFDENWFGEEEGEFKITGEEFFQHGIILAADTSTGCLHTVHQIAEAADEAATYANCYEYELQDMQGVYDKTSEIESLCDQLKSELAAAKPFEESYMDILGKLTGALNGDATIPEDVRKKADLLLAQLQTLLFPYSA